MRSGSVVVFIGSKNAGTANPVELSNSLPVIFGRTPAVRHIAAANSPMRLFYMCRDEFGHLEPADLLLATKDHLQRLIGVDPTCDHGKDVVWLNRFHESSVWHAASGFFGFGQSDLLRFHRRRRWIGGLELAEPLFFLLGLLFKVSLPLFELIVWFCQFVILLQV